MMKQLLLIGMWLVDSYSAPAQTAQEWFAQKETQLRYLRESLSALQAYAGQVQEGYDIARGGLSFIQELRQGDLWLHSDRMASLRRVPPPVTDYAAALAPDTLLAEIRTVCRSLLRTLALSGQLSAPELRYHQDITSGLLEEAGGILRAVHRLTEEGGAELTEGERLRRLCALTEQLRERYARARQLAASSLRLAHQRYRARRELPALRQYHHADPTH